MEYKAYTHLFNDVYSNVLQLSENPSQFAEYLTLQIRELIGTRTVIIAVKTETDIPKVLSVYPERRKDWANQSSILQLAELSFGFENIQYCEKEKCEGNIVSLLQNLEIEKAIVIPLITGDRVVGSILLLDIMDLFGKESVIDLLSQLSGVFALVIRNAHLYHDMENLVELRTLELKNQNTKLVKREEELQAANEEYEVLNEELNENINKSEEINRQLNEAQLRADKSELQARDILQTTMDGFWIVDNDGNFTEVNEVACKMLGYSKDEMLRMKVSDIEVIENAEKSKKTNSKITKNR